MPCLSKFVLAEISRDYVVIFQSFLRRILILENIPSWADINLFTLAFAVFSCYLLKASYPSESSTEAQSSWLSALANSISLDFSRTRNRCILHYFHNTLKFASYRIFCRITILSSLLPTQL